MNKYGDFTPTGNFNINIKKKANGFHKIYKLSILFDLSNLIRYDTYITKNQNSSVELILDSWSK